MKYGRWHAVHTRMSRWAEAGVLRVKSEVVQLDNTSVKVHPDGTGAVKTGILKPSDAAGPASTPRFIWLPRVSNKSSASASRPARRTTRHPAHLLKRLGIDKLQVPPGHGSRLRRQ